VLEIIPWLAPYVSLTYPNRVALQKKSEKSELSNLSRIYCAIWTKQCSIF